MPTNPAILRLLEGFRKFQENYFHGQDSIYRQPGQAPKTLVIACSDSRVDPAILTGAEPGEIFVVRNVANLVPPFETTGQYHGVSSAIEFAVTGLKVQNLIVLGHRQCGGIQALMQSEPTEKKSFITKWVSIASEAKQKVLKKYSETSFEEQCRHCEMESIGISIKNLATFPFIQEAVGAGKLTILGLYFDLESGEILELDQSSGVFEIVDLSKY